MDTTTIVVVIALALALAVVVVYLVARGSSQPGELTSPPRPGVGVVLRRALTSSLDAESWDAIETALLEADVGVLATGEIVENLRRSAPDSIEEAVAVLREGLVAEMSSRNRDLQLDGVPVVVLVVGVNGTGKTTTIAKLAKRFLDDGRTVVLAAADTFRAAAGAQLQTWGDRLGVRVIGGQEGGDPASVVYDTLESARSNDVDVVLVDTAGRLHGKKNLMAELAKIQRVAGGDQVDEVLLVLDATLGQNGLAQAREFAGAVPLTGLVLAKMDGTAKGGIVVAVERELGLPVKFVGVGEGVDDLEPFDSERFVESLVGVS